MTGKRWIGAAVVVVLGIALIEQWDSRVAMGAAVLILLAVFFRYPAALGEVRKMLGV